MQNEDQDFQKIPCLSLIHSIYLLSSALGNDSVLNGRQANEHTLKPVASLDERRDTDVHCLHLRVPRGEWRAKSWTLPPQGRELRSVSATFLPGHSNACPQLAPVSCGEQRGCTGVGVAFAPEMEFVGRWKCRRRSLEKVPPSAALREAEQLSGGISPFHMAVHVNIAL